MLRKIYHYMFCWHRRKPYMVKLIFCSSKFKDIQTKFDLIPSLSAKTCEAACFPNCNLFFCSLVHSFCTQTWLFQVFPNCMKPVFLFERTKSDSASLWLAMLTAHTHIRYTQQKERERERETSAFVELWGEIELILVQFLIIRF